MHLIFIQIEKAQMQLLCNYNWQFWDSLPATQNSSHSSKYVTQNFNTAIIWLALQQLPILIACCLCNVQIHVFNNKLI